MYTLINTYRFVCIDDPERFGYSCYRIARSLNLTGTLIFAKEGFNIAINGPNQAVRRFFEDSQILYNFVNSDEKSTSDSLWRECCSHSHFHVFPHLKKYSIKRLRIRIKEEIIHSNFQHLLTLNRINDRDVSHIHPIDFHHKLSNNTNVVVIDMRNDYEVAIGTFANAVHLQLKKFSELKNHIHNIEEYRDKEILTFCTGGIRCEKSHALLQALGFPHVYQLDGGIFNYLRYFSNGRWHGNCFVFDDRVALGSDLMNGDYDRCDVCGQASHRKSGICSYHTT